MAAVLGLLLVTQFVFPGQVSHGTPAAVLFEGLVVGLLNSLLAVGIVLIYRSHRVINFAQLALGFLAALFTYNLTALVGFPFLVSFVLGTGVGALTGLAFDLAFVRRFQRAPRLVLTVFTILASGALVGLNVQLDLRLPLWPEIGDRTQEQLARQDMPVPFSTFEFHVGDFPLRFGFAHLFAVGACVLVLVGLAAFFRYTKVGIAVRASAENAERAGTLGISVNVVSMIVWSLAGALAAVSLIGQNTVADSFPYAAAGPDQLLIALAAAIVARMRSLPVAAAAAVGLSVFSEAFSHSFRDDAVLLPAVFLLVIVAGLLVQRSRLARSEESEATSWQVIEEPRPIPRQMQEIPGILATRRAFGVVVGAGLVIFPWVVPSRQANLGGFYAAVALVFLSLVILTGWGGQVSLGQFAFVAAGAVVGGALTSRAGVSFWLALLITPLLTAVLTMLVGFPALRIKGLFLGVATLALAFAATAVLFQERYFGWLLPSEVDRPRLFMFDFEDERSMYYLVLSLLALSTWAVVALRRSRPGRLLIGLRENEANVRSFGVSPVRMRLTAFALSGFLCGLAGFLLAHHQRAVTDASFTADLSVQVFIFSMLGGVASVFGVLMGVTYFAIVNDFVTDAFWRFAILSSAPLVILWLFPGGFIQMFTSVRDNVLRIVAQRRQMVVPSLFADYDPEVLERALIPLAEPVAGSGAERLPAGRSYQKESALYGERGADGGAARRPSHADSVVLDAAVRQMEETPSP